MRYVLLIATLGFAFATDIDPREIVRRSVNANEGENEKLARNYNFQERVETRRLRRDGGVKSTSSKIHEILMLEGSPHRLLLAHDDEPLPPQEQRAQQESLKKAIEARRKESEHERAKRLREYKKRRDKYRKAIREIPDAFNLRLVGEETIDSRPAYVIEATPRRGYQPIDRYSRLFTQLKGKLWIDKADYHWVRAEAELLDTVSFAWILVRIGKGARVKIEQTRVNDEVWLPRRLWFVVSLRIGLIKVSHIEQETRYKSHRRSHADVHAVSTAEFR
jgi:hypothetical protein